MDYPITIADQLATQLRSLRQARAVTQKDLAKMLGVTQSRVAAIERNPGAVSAGQLFDILRVLGASMVIRDLKPSVHTVMGAPPGTRYGTPTASQGVHKVDEPNAMHGKPTPISDDQGGDW